MFPPDPIVVKCFLTIIPGVAESSALWFRGHMVLTCLIISGINHDFLAWVVSLRCHLL